MNRTWASPLSAAGVLVVSASINSAAALAQEYCVICSKPAATYRCKVENVGPSQPKPLQLSCIQALATEGKHEACSIGAGTVMDCDGPIKRIDVLGKPGKAEAPGVTAAKAPAEPYVLPEPKKPEPDLNAPPKTVEEALRRAGKSTSDSASKTGQALSDGAKKTWSCLTSFFKAC